MIKNIHHIKYIACFFLKIILASAFTPVFTAVASDNPEHSTISSHLYQPYYYESTDGEETDAGQTPPENLSQMIAMLRENPSSEEKSDINNILFLHRDEMENKDEYYLRMQKIEDANKVFFALRSIYGSAIACDTCTILLTYQLKLGLLSLKLLYNFLVARISSPKEKLLSYSHPYHTTMHTLFQKAGVKIIYAVQNKDKSFPENFSINEGTVIVLSTQVHMSIVRALPDEQYQYSAWNPTDGITYYTNDLGRPNDSQFDSSIGKFGIIEKGKQQVELYS